MTVRKPTSAGLAKALRSKIGRACFFTHPETGQVISGTYQRGRKVRELTGVTIDKAATGSRTYDFHETVWKVPPHVAITFGTPPRVPKKPDYEGSFATPKAEHDWHQYVSYLERQLDAANVSTGHTYTRTLDKAVQFASREAAQRECCENERPRQIDNSRKRSSTPKE